MIALTTGLLAKSPRLGHVPDNRKWCAPHRWDMRVTRTRQGSPAVVAELMGAFLTLGGHESWPDDVSLFDHAHVFRERLLDSAQVTDSYSLALAEAHGGKLATFDRRMVASAIIGGSSAIHLIV